MKLASRIGEGRNVRTASVCDEIKEDMAARASTPNIGVYSHEREGVGKLVLVCVDRKAYTSHTQSCGGKLFVAVAPDLIVRTAGPQRNPDHTAILLARESDIKPVRVLLDHD